MPSLGEDLPGLTGTSRRLANSVNCRTVYTLPPLRQPIPHFVGSAAPCTGYGQLCVRGCALRSPIDKHHREGRGHESVGWYRAGAFRLATSSAIRSP